MRTARAALGLTVLLTSMGTTAVAASPRASYMIHCMGCHLADGRGVVGRVPTLVGSARFLATPRGRVYLVQVPGTAQSPLADAETAELLNWLLAEFSAAELPDDFRPYTEQEVRALRRQPLLDPAGLRRELLLEIAAPR